MPNYSFSCGGCDHEFEIFLKMSENDKPTKEKCPKCGKKKVTKNWGAQRNSVAFDSTLNANKVCGGAWNEVISKIKNSGVVPKRYHARLDESGSKTNARYVR